MMANTQSQRHQQRRQVNLLRAQAIADDTGLSLDCAKKWLQFHGFRADDAMVTFGDVHRLAGGSQSITVDIIEAIFRSKQFAPFKFGATPGKDVSDG